MSIPRPRVYLPVALASGFFSHEQARTDRALRLTRAMLRIDSTEIWRSECARIRSFAPSRSRGLDVIRGAPTRLQSALTYLVPRAGRCRISRRAGWSCGHDILTG